MHYFKFLITTILFTLSTICIDAQEQSFRNMSLPLEARIDSLIDQLTLHEKVLLMRHNAPAIERLSIPAYNWWNEALHGVARTTEKVTVFPQAIAMAATFDPTALQRAADIISTEGRAIFNTDLKNTRTGENYRGLTYWTPNINIFRDPRWGRGQETYGEDPFLTSIMGAAFVRGLEGNHPYYLKAVACAKHFAVHSGPEHNRHSFNSQVSPYDLWNTYLPAFKYLVMNANVHGIMCAYNRLDGVPCCANDTLLHNILRNKWGFNGYVVTDCWAISDFLGFHKTHSSEIIAISDALLSGADLECGALYQKLEDAVADGNITEQQIDESLMRLLEIQFKLGLYDEQDSVVYSNIDMLQVDCTEHKQHALLMAQESMVLLKNSKNILPLNASKIKRIAIIGPNANNAKTLLANYNGTPSSIVTPYQALVNRYGQKIEISYTQGVGIVDTLPNAPAFTEVAKQAQNADVIIFIGGISADYEGEAGDAGAAGYFGFASGDRTSIALPKVQTQLIQELKKTKRPIIMVNMSGSVMSFEWESQNVDAILQAWYGGQSAGDAVVDVLFGKYNPAGRMPVTSYLNDSSLPNFEDYSMQNRTYRYFNGKVLYPFGYGLSYTKFRYSNLKTSGNLNNDGLIEIQVDVTNAGKVSGDEVVQLYISHPNLPQPKAICELKGFSRINLKPNERKTVKFTLNTEQLSTIDNQGDCVGPTGIVELFVGGGQPQYASGQNVTLNL